MKALVTYNGPSQMHSHRCRITGHEFVFHLGIPIEMTDPKDIAFYQTRGGFTVEVTETGMKTEKKSAKEVIKKALKREKKKKADTYTDEELEAQLEASTEEGE